MVWTLMSHRIPELCLSSEKLCSEEAVATGIVKYNFNSLGTSVRKVFIFCC